MRRTTLLLMFVGACAAEDAAPTVSILSATPQSLTPSNDLADDLRILVTYEDDDGDLGEGIARIHDCRADALVTELAIPAIAPPDVIGDKITGSLDLALDDVGAVAAGALPTACSELGVAALAPDATVFCVVLVDAKQHAGPGDCTQPISLTP